MEKDTSTMEPKTRGMASTCGTGIKLCRGNLTSREAGSVELTNNHKPNQWHVFALRLHTTLIYLALVGLSFSMPLEGHAEPRLGTQHQSDRPSVIASLGSDRWEQCFFFGPSLNPVSYGVVTGRTQLAVIRIDTGDVLAYASPQIISSTVGVMAAKATLLVFERPYGAIDDSRCRVRVLEIFSGNVVPVYKSNFVFLSQSPVVCPRVTLRGMQLDVFVFDCVFR
jgi:hypothetical protein